jgi:lysine-specific demethylase 3
MMHAGPTESGKPGNARWTMFHKDDRETIRTFLRAQGHVADGRDPVHSQLYFFSDDLLAKLKADYNVVPFDFHQFQGQAVFVPVLTPHQVCSIFPFNTMFLALMCFCLGGQ